MAFFYGNSLTPRMRAARSSWAGLQRRWVRDALKATPASCEPFEKPSEALASSSKTTVTLEQGTPVIVPPDQTPRLRTPEEAMTEWKEWTRRQTERDRKDMAVRNWRGALKACIAASLLAGVPLYMLNERRGVIAKGRNDSVGKPKLGGPWTLVNPEGAFVSSTDFRGQYQLVYFGFSLCPDICPQELEKMTQALEILEKKGVTSVVPVYISVDPARDTVAQIEAYKKDFHPSLQALTGTPEQIRKTAKAFRVYFNQGIQSGGEEDYLVDHSIITYLMDTRGKFLDFFGRNITAREMAEKIEKILKADAKKAVDEGKKKMTISDA